jgi:hypothetical protein
MDDRAGDHGSPTPKPADISMSSGMNAQRVARVTGVITHALGFILVRSA